MSRSYRHCYIFGCTTAKSEKMDKRFANRALRRKVNMGNYDLRLRDVSNVYGFDKDGKHYWPDAPKKAMSK